MPDSADPLDAWLTDVATGAATMSQRGTRWVEKAGGIDTVVAAARKRGVHLLRLTDDAGKVLIAASREPFETLC